MMASWSAPYEQPQPSLSLLLLHARPVLFPASTFSSPTSSSAVWAPRLCPPNCSLLLPRGGVAARALPTFLGFLGFLPSSPSSSPTRLPAPPPPEEGEGYPELGGHDDDDDHDGVAVGAIGAP